MSQLTQVFTILQPRCTRAYGAAPCTAALGVTGERKCFNTRATCQDPDNYSTAAGTGLENVVRLRFAMQQENLLPLGPLLPCIVGIDITPGSINLGGMDKGQGALGQREVLTVRMDDFLHSDAQTDPYRLERRTGAAMADPADAYDPYTRGTFWGKWQARNPYSQHYPCTLQEYDLEDPDAGPLWTRYYVLDRIDGPSNGQVTVTAKDAFTLIEEQKAMAPPPSRGYLSSNLTAGGTSFTAQPSGIGNLDYPMAGSPSELTVCIGHECIRASRSGDTFTVIQRGAFGTTAESHDAEDAIQWVLRYDTQHPQDIVYDLLTGYSSVSADSIDLADWDAQAAVLSSLYTGRIATPTPVEDLIGELCEQAGFTVWPEVETGMIRFAPLRAQAITRTVDDSLIVEGSLSLKHLTDQRASEVWVYYGQIDPTVELDERSNYRSRAITDDPAAEGDDQYGTPAVREIFSRWIPQFGRTAALDVGERVLAMFRDPPVEATFAEYATAAPDYSLARCFALQLADLQDDTGAAAPATMVAFAIEQQDDRVIVGAREVSFFTSDPSAQRVIFIENDIFDANLRTIHDSLYAAPEAGSPALQVLFIVMAGITVGASSTANAAMVTGDWPDGIDLELQVDGRIVGAGGRAGRGSSYPPSAQNGQPGGIGLQATVDIRLSGSGLVAGGGGGGGGGGAGLLTTAMAGGGGGGGGAGVVAGPGAAGGVDISRGVANGAAGHTGGDEDGGTGGSGANFENAAIGGKGGDGGDLGEPGEDGHAATAGTGKTPPGTGGAAGLAISGMQYVASLGSPAVTLVGDVDSAVKASAVFDGSDTMSRGANLSGIGDARSGIVSFWLRLDAGDGTAQTILYGSDAGGADGVWVARESDNKLHIQDNTGSSVSFGLFSSATYTAGATWRHVLASWNGSTGAKHLYVNDVSAIDGAISVANNVDTAYATCVDWTVGDDGFGETLRGAIAELYFAPGHYLDFSVEANRRKFRTAGGAPAELGNHGELPTGDRPAVYLSHHDGAALADFAANRGDGGDFTVSGTLADGGTFP